MKVLVFSSLAFSLVNFRGALLTRLRSENHEVIATAPDRDERVERWLDQRGIVFQQIPMNRTGTKPLQDIRTLWAYLRLLMKEKPDLIVAYTQKPIIYGGIAARLAGNIPFFALMSGLGYLFSPDGSKPGIARSIFIHLYRAGVRKARKIFVFNRDDRDDMLAAGIITGQHQVVQVPGSGIDTDHFAFHPLPEGGPHFLMVGRLMRDKGVYEFLNAARQLSKTHKAARFSIVGRAETLNPTGIKADEVAALQRDYPVTFLEETTDVRPYFAQCSVFVLPSYYREGLPRTILEAMSTGRAVVTTDMPGCRDPIEDGVNGFVVPARDADALASAMRKFITDPDLISMMGSQSRKIAERVYDVNRVNDMLIEHMGLSAGSTASAAHSPEPELSRMAVERT